MNKPFWHKATSSNLGLPHYWQSLEKHRVTYKIPPYTRMNFASPMYNLELFEWRFIDGKRFEFIRKDGTK